MDSDTDEFGSGVFVQFPLPDERLFRNRAMEDVLLHFVRNPHGELTVTELREVTGHGGDTVQTAIDVLERADLITTRREGRKRLISANRDRIHNPDDPLLSIPQEEFRSPVAAFLERARDRQGDNLVGVVLFGSVARGDADRASDVDVQVIVEDDLTEARRELQAVRRAVETRTFDGNRYQVQLLVESVETATRHGAALRELFSEGIVLHATDRLDDVEEAVFGGA